MSTTATANNTVANLTLNEELKAKSAEMAKVIPQEVLARASAARAHYVAEGVEDRALKVGDQAPKFQLPGVDGKVFDSEEALAKGPLAVVFYRGGWCPYCNVANRALARAYPEIEATGGSIVVISPEKPEAVSKEAADKGLAFPALADDQLTVARKFGIVFEFTDDLRSLYSDVFKMNLPEYNGTEKWELPLPVTFIIGKDGVIADTFVKVDYTTRQEPKEIVAALKKLAQ